MKAIKNLSLVIVILITLGGCKSYYDAYSHQETIEVKNQTLVLMDSSVFKYNKYQVRLDSLKVKITNLYEYQKKRQNNIIVVEQWNTLLRDNGTFNNFFNYWKESDTVSKGYLKYIKPQMSKSFDKIIELETKKKQ